MHQNGSSTLYNATQTTKSMTHAILPHRLHRTHPSGSMPSHKMGNPAYTARNDCNQFIITTSCTDEPSELAKAPRTHSRTTAAVLHPHRIHHHHPFGSTSSHQSCTSCLRPDHHNTYCADELFELAQEHQGHTGPATAAELHPY